MCVFSISNDLFRHEKKILEKIKYPRYNLRYYMQGHNSLNTFSLEYWLGLANAHRI